MDAEGDGEACAEREVENGDDRDAASGQHELDGLHDRARALLSGRIQLQDCQRQNGQYES